jgi:arylsulfatase A-like enzyme
MKRLWVGLTAAGLGCAVAAYAALRRGGDARPAAVTDHAFEVARAHARWDAASAASSDAPARKPNILLIVADDLGYSGVGVQGCGDIPTPAIDALAAGGVQFTQAYVTAPVCSPSRAAMLTGRYQERFGSEFNPRALKLGGLDLQQQTLANYMRAAGYHTGLVGKWHLGSSDDHRPTRRGFDEFFGFLGGGHTYEADSKIPLLRADDEWSEREYLTKAFGREAIDFIQRNKEHPFFLYLAFNAVHLPMDPDVTEMEKVQKIEDPLRRVHASMLASMDDEIAKVMSKLRELDLQNDTLVMFLSDNGAPRANKSTNIPLRSYKHHIYEGGIRVPWIMSWPGHLPAGREFTAPVTALDVVPTALAAAGSEGADASTFDGVNLLDYLTGKVTGRPHETLFWRYGQAFAIRRGDWKLLRRDCGRLELYDVGKDVAEQHDLAPKRPELVKRLHRAYLQWSDAVGDDVPPELRARFRCPHDDDRRRDDQLHPSDAGEDDLESEGATTDVGADASAEGKHVRHDERRPRSPG